MEVQFAQIPHRCLKQMVWDLKNMEETLELRTPDSSGVLLGAWGQCVIRSKQWERSEVGVSGGVMVWVLYQTEAGQIQCAEGWIPFRRSWELRDSQRDGCLTVQCALRSVDARTTGPGKVLVRACVSLWAEAMEPGLLQSFQPEKLPEDICLLTEEYPLQLPVEVGEKALSVEEELMLSSGLPTPKRILCSALEPKVAEQKLMADKLVFRGGVKLQLLYEDADGRVRRFEADVPMSQYIQLEGEYGPEAASRVCPAVTELDTELMDDGRIRLKAGIVGQYLITDRCKIPCVSDAYSNRRSVTAQRTQIPVPVVLDQCQSQLQPLCRLNVEAREVVDHRLYAAHPRMERENRQVAGLVEGMAQVLYYDYEDRLQCAVTTFEADFRLPADEKCRILATVEGFAPCEAEVQTDGVTLNCELGVNAVTMGTEGLEAVSGLQYGELEAPDPKRPSLILQRSGDRTLWQLAKACGSTVEAIQAANGLSGQPEADRLLLIPVS